MGFPKLLDSIVEQGQQDPARLEEMALGRLSGNDEITSPYNDFVKSNLPSFISQPAASQGFELPPPPQSVGLMPFPEEQTDFNQLAGLLAGPMPDMPEPQSMNFPSVNAFPLQPVSTSGSTPPGVNGTIIPVDMQEAPFISQERLRESIEDRRRRIQPAPLGAPLDPILAERIRRGLI